MKQILVALLILCSAAHGQQVEQVIKNGNDLYRQQQYEPAKAAYEEALRKDPTNTAAKFNLGNTNYRLSKPADAIKSYDELAAWSTDPADRARAWYNKGAILSTQKKLEESIEAYKNALRQNPNDKEARENLQKALLELKKKNPPPPKKENEKKKQQNKKQQQQPKMNPKEAEQKLKLLQQKEKELQQRMQKKNQQSGTPNDW